MKTPSFPWRVGVVGLAVGFAAGALVFKSSRPPTSATQVPATTVVNASEPGRPMRPVRVLIKTREPFDWVQLESADYHQYIANLRRVGCPEETIRDLLIADICRTYTARQRALFENLPFRYWESRSVFDRLRDGEPGAAEIHVVWQSLEREKRDLVRHLLGVDLRVELERLAGGDIERQVRLSFLSPEKQSRVAAALFDFDEAFAAHLRTADAGLGPAGVPGRYWSGLEEMLRPLVSPEELAELEFRLSPVAEQLRERLAGFDATEEEFRQLLAIEKAFPADLSDGNELSADEEARRGAALRQALGDARHADYQRVSSPRFGQLYELTGQDGDRAAAAHSLWQQAEAAAEAVRVAATDAAAAEAAAGINRELSTALEQVLGPDTFAEFQQRHGEDFEIAIPEMVSAEPIPPGEFE